MATVSTPIRAPTAEKMQAAIERLVAVAQPTKIILFGSQARGDADDHSDVDLLVIKPYVADGYEELIELDRSWSSALRSEQVGSMAVNRAISRETAPLPNVR